MKRATSSILFVAAALCVAVSLPVIPVAFGSSPALDPDGGHALAGRPVAGTRPRANTPGGLPALGYAWAWGSNSNGQLGDGSTVDRSLPVRVPSYTAAAAVSGGAFHSLALNTDGSVSAWGLNAEGQLGNGGTVQSDIPVVVSNLASATEVSAGYWHSLALTSDGTVWAWGYNADGELGDGTTTQRQTPVAVSDLAGVVAINAGYWHNLALRSDGTVWAWGNNSFGQLGDGTSTNRTVPIQVSGLSGVIAVAAGKYHSLALRSDGTVWAWGQNSHGQLGTGDSANRLTPVPVVAVSGVAVITAGAFHSLALRSDGTVWAWGENSSGQLGDGTTVNSSAPLQITTLARASAIAAGRSHSLTLLSDGSLWTWGDNGFGQLGTGTTTNSPVPVQVPGLSGVVAIGSGNLHTLAITPLPPLPAAPSGLTATGVTGSSVALSWVDNATNEIGYVVERSSGGGFVQVGATLPANSTSFTDTTAQGDASYSYRVKAINDGGSSGYSNSVFVTMPPLPPSALSVSAVNAVSVSLTWQDQSTTESGYVVERKTSSGSYVQVGGTLPANSTGYTDRDVAQYTNYTYRVKAISAAGSSGYSNEVAVKTYSRNEDTSINVKYRGLWTKVSSSQCSGGSCHKSTDPNGNASLTWAGTDVQVVMTTGPMMGKAYVVVDGALVVVDLYSPTLQYQQLVYAKTGLAVGSHTVKVSASGIKNPASSGTAVGLDAFETR